MGELPDTVRSALESAIGPVRDVEPVSAGLNCGIAALLHTPTQTVFIKGLRSDHPRIATQRREAEINRHVAPIAPRQLCQVDTDGWTVLGFEHLNGRHANLSPGSADLPTLADTLTRLGQIRCPDMPLKRLEDRWAGLANHSELQLLAGDSLLHTDLNPHNILINDTAHIVDWVWPTLGDAWIDPVCAALWLIAEGHPPQPPKPGRLKSRPGPPRPAPASTPSPRPAAGCGSRLPTTIPNPGNSDYPPPPKRGPSTG